MIKHYRLNLKNISFLLTRSKTTSLNKFDVINPLNGKVVDSVSDQGTEEVQAVIEKAHKAFLPWRKLSAKHRSKLLMNMHALVLKNKERLAHIITLENGKPLSEAMGEVLYGAEYIEWFGEEGKRVYGDVVMPSVNDRRCFILKEPIGVCGMITPWNFPHAMVARKIAPALVVGCPVVLKPSDETPLSALALGELAKEAGFPDGVFNIVTSSRDNTPEIGELICTSPLIKKLSFTGSTQIGKIIMGYAQSNIKKLSLELGGNAPYIVFESADVGRAVDGLMSSKFRASGQTCVCANRIFVHEKVHEEFISKLKEAMKSNLKLGDGLSPDTTQGPLINKDAVEKVMSQIADAVSKGACVVEGGRKMGWGDGGKRDGDGKVVELREGDSCFVEPTILTGVTSDCDCFNEETFGPLVPVVKFSSEQEVVAMANNTPSGLAGYFYSRDNDQIWRVAEALEVGMVGANLGVLGLVQMPFGGVKESGWGREGSKYGLDDYLVIKSFNMALNSE